MRIPSHEERTRRLLRRMVLCSAVTAGLSMFWTTFAIWTMYHVGMGVARAVGEVRTGMNDLFEVNDVSEFSRQVDEMERRSERIELLSSRAAAARRRM